MGRTNRKTEAIIRNVIALVIALGVFLYVTGLLGPVLEILTLLIAGGFILFMALIGLMAYAQKKKWIGTLVPKSPGPNTLPEGGFNILEALDGLDWFQLEKLVAALFRFQGKSVEERGGAKADGGVDLVVYSDESTALVQCKHWANWKCFPSVVRELIGSMTHEGIANGILVCREATPQAKALASEHNIQIIERPGLFELLKEALEANDDAVKQALFYPPKLCPKCGSAMVLRTVSRGKNSGSQFWGCSKYPSCRQVLPFRG